VIDSIKCAEKTNRAFKQTDEVWNNSNLHKNRQSWLEICKKISGKGRGQKPIRGERSYIGMASVCITACHLFLCSMEAEKQTEG
jgi:hypothetical protein